MKETDHILNGSKKDEQREHLRKLSGQKTILELKINESGI